MPENVIIVDKAKGQTPLEVIQNLKKMRSELRLVPMTYAGRLDPLATGVLIVLIGDECLKKDEYLALPKEYKVSVLFGFATDTYDILGKIVANVSPAELFERFSDLLARDSLEERGQTVSKEVSGVVPDISGEVRSQLKEFTGRINQNYPPYSSRTVDGKPLFQWAREGKLDEIEIPSHDVFVESITLDGMSSVSGKELGNKIQEDIATVSGDFRQDEILEIWKEKLSGMQEIEFPITNLTIRCGSGVYVRSIAHELGQKFGIPALALDIRRTKVGAYTI